VKKSHTKTGVAFEELTTTVDNPVDNLTRRPI
jgi:hypothetical protein